jgi:hypothetical protein
MKFLIINLNRRLKYIRFSQIIANIQTIRLKSTNHNQKLGGNIELFRYPVFTTKIDKKQVSHRLLLYQKCREYTLIPDKEPKLEVCGVFKDVG